VSLPAVLRPLRWRLLAKRQSRRVSSFSAFGGGVCSGGGVLHDGATGTMVGRGGVTSLCPAMVTTGG
jgi:hypothetical protein